MVGKIGTVTKRTPAKPAVKRVAKPGAKPAVKRVAKPGVKPAVKRVANAAKPGVKRAAKPVAKRAGVKRATPKAKKVNFDKLLIIIRNVANRTHKKGRMTGGAVDDAMKTIKVFLSGDDFKGAFNALKTDDTLSDNFKGSLTAVEIDDDAEKTISNLTKIDKTKIDGEYGTLVGKSGDSVTNQNFAILMIGITLANIYVLFRVIREASVASNNGAVRLASNEGPARGDGEASGDEAARVGD